MRVCSGQASKSVRTFLWGHLVDPTEDLDSLVISTLFTIGCTLLSIVPDIYLLFAHLVARPRELVGRLPGTSGPRELQRVGKSDRQDLGDPGE